MTKRTKKPDDAADAPRAPETTDTALGDRMGAALNDLRWQLRKGEAVALPDFLRGALRDDPVEGDRVKVDEWRSFVVWAEWTGDEWAMLIYQDGKPRE